MSDAKTGVLKMLLSIKILMLCNCLYSLLGPCLPFILIYWDLYWMSKCQTVRAGSSAEAEIYAMNECVKFLLELVQLWEFLGVHDTFMPGVTTIFNDNNACVNWSNRCTTKGLCHIQMREIHVRENVEWKFVTISHIGGKHNLADLFTKEMNVRL